MGTEYSKAHGCSVSSGWCFLQFFHWVREDDFHIGDLKIRPSMNECKNLSKPRRDVY